MRRRGGPGIAPCDVCGHALILDATSVTDLARYGFEGGRWYCPLGCRDVWMKSRPAAVPILKGARQTSHDVRCRCGAVFTTLAPNARYCPRCRAVA